MNNTDYRIVTRAGTAFATRQAKDFGLRVTAWIEKPEGGYIPIRVPPDKMVTIHNDSIEPITVSLSVWCADGSGSSGRFAVEPGNSTTIEGNGAHHHTNYGVMSVSAEAPADAAMPRTPATNPDLSVFSDEAWAARLANALGISKKEAQRSIRTLRAAAKAKRKKEATL